jgi:hypothetical protein
MRDRIRSPKGGTSSGGNASYNPMGNYCTCGEFILVEGILKGSTAG